MNQQTGLRHDTVWNSELTSLTRLHRTNGFEPTPQSKQSSNRYPNKSSFHHIDDTERYGPQTSRDTSRPLHERDQSTFDRIQSAMHLLEIENGVAIFFCSEIQSTSRRVSAGPANKSSGVSCCNTKHIALWTPCLLIGAPRQPEKRSLN